MCVSAPALQEWVQTWCMESLSRDFKSDKRLLLVLHTSSPTPLVTLTPAGSSRGHQEECPVTGGATDPAHFQEACESIAGFSGSVPRYLSVEVTGLNENGEDVTWKASGWPARILQHEMDHLNGILYIDRMDSKTFVNITWQSYNE
ncbi:peptide deformylase, mitochondrial [Brachionichthys hirsutus]|uniref:peptide deformylase, mitochondrial n=1 Tax=Brachionichthys hirsutus TaxID=412623 RepID=UPI0036044461